MLTTLRTALHRWDWIFLLCLVPLTTWYWLGIPSVPFHPDEASNIYLSSDIETFFSDPLSLSWNPLSQDHRQDLRLKDAPLGRYLIGLARWLTGSPALAVDWDWSQDWNSNAAAGALPASCLLNTSRWGGSILFPFTLLLMYWTGLRLQGRLLAWLGALLLATNPLFLLHSRRAMSEGSLLFCVVFFMACLITCKQKTWLAAVPAALAFCAKHSAIPLAGVGMLLVWLRAGWPARWNRLLLLSAAYLGLFAAIAIAMYPIIWKEPLKALQAAISARQELVTSQTQDFGQIAPEMILDSPWKAAFTMLVNLFILPPSFSETGNYLEQIRESEVAYMLNPLHSLLRGIYIGGILFTFCLFGCAWVVGQWFRPTAKHRLEWGLVGLAGASLFFALSVTLKLPFQRYVMPLLPFASLYTAAGLYAAFSKFSQVIYERRKL